MSLESPRGHLQSCNLWWKEMTACVVASVWTQVHVADHSRLPWLTVVILGSTPRPGWSMDYNKPDFLQFLQRHSRLRASSHVMGTQTKSHHQSQNKRGWGRGSDTCHMLSNPMNMVRWCSVFQYECIQARFIRFLWLLWHYLLVEFPC